MPFSVPKIRCTGDMQIIMKFVHNIQAAHMYDRKITIYLKS